MRSLGFAGILARYYNENRGSGDGLPPQFRGYSPDIGEVQERLNWRHWKCRVLKRDRGFESHPLRFPSAPRSADRRRRP